MDDQSKAGGVFVQGLKNAHAMETQALSIMRPQVKRIENYPEVKARLEQHIEETEGQIARLEAVLERFGHDKSMLRDTALSLAGTMAALTHSTAPDEILKNSFANYAFENYEIAAYESLITLAQAAGASEAVASLERNLEEERAMADWLSQNLAAVTHRYVGLAEAGETAKK
jgi:ferritin-like metal-binding protein YciE